METALTAGGITHRSSVGKSIFSRGGSARAAIASRSSKFVFGYPPIERKGCSVNRRRMAATNTGEGSIKVQMPRWRTPFLEQLLRRSTPQIVQENPDLRPSSRLLYSRPIIKQESSILKEELLVNDEFSALLVCSFDYFILYTITSYIQLLYTIKGSLNGNRKIVDLLNFRNKKSYNIFVFLNTVCSQFKDSIFRICRKFLICNVFMSKKVGKYLKFQRVIVERRLQS